MVLEIVVKNGGCWEEREEIKRCKMLKRKTGLKREEAWWRMVGVDACGAARKG